MTLPDPPFPLAQSTEFEVGATFIVNASVDVDDACCDSDSIFIEVPNSDAIVVGLSFVDVVSIVPTSFVLVANASPVPLDTPHASSLCSLPSPECHTMPFADFHDMLQGDMSDYMDSLGTFRGYDPSFDPYSLYLESVPLKTTFVTAFTSFTDFSKAFDKFVRALVIISAFLFKCLYLHTSEFHAQVFDKLLRALTASELVAWTIRREGVADAPSTSRSTVLRR